MGSWANSWQAEPDPLVRGPLPWVLECSWTSPPPILIAGVRYTLLVAPFVLQSCKLESPSAQTAGWLCERGQAASTSSLQGCALISMAGKCDSIAGMIAPYKTRTMQVSK